MIEQPIQQSLSQSLGADALDERLLHQARRVCEAAAIAAARWRGFGERVAADQAAVDAMRAALMVLEISGTVVIGEGERDEAPMLYIGEAVGKGTGLAVDIALDPLEGTNLCATSSANALTVMALAPKGGLLNAPDLYMEKIAVGAHIGDDVVSLTQTPEENLHAIASKLKGQISDLQVCILERDRHADLIARVRRCGARVQLISDGDIFACLQTSDRKSGIHAYFGTGGAPEGVLAAAALKVLGGCFQGRLLCRNEKERARAEKMGIIDFDTLYNLDDLVKGDVMFAASGVTDGTLLDGVRFEEDGIAVHSLLMHEASKRIETVRARLPLRGVE